MNPELPPSLADVITRCLERDPARRYQSATAVLADLDSGNSLAARGFRSRTLLTTLDRRQRTAVFLAGALLAVCGALAFLVWPFVPTRQNGVSRGVYLAIVPFRALGSDDALRHQAEGISDALSAKLLQLHEIRLASPVAVDDKIARSVGVKLIVRGAVQTGPASGRITATVKLEDVENKRLLWTTRVSAGSGDLINVEDQIYAGLINALAISPSTQERTRSAAHPTDNMQAYDLYLRGRASIRDKRDEASVRTAMDRFSTAISLDPRFGLAYASIADANMYMHDLTRDSTWLERAHHFASEATHWAPDAPESHIAMGSAYRATGKVNEAIAEFQRALRLEPNSDEACRRLATAFKDSGREAEALEYFRKAIDANPYYWMNYNQAGAAYMSFGDYPRALDCFLKVTEIAPENPSGHLNAGAIYFHEGQYEQAVSQFQRAVQLKANWQGYVNLSACYYNLGRYAEAVQMAERAVALNRNDDLAAGNLADAYRLLHRRDKAQGWYERAVALAYKALEANPRNVEAMGRLAMYYAKEGNKPRATESIARARSMAPDDVELLFDEAVIHALAGDYDGGLRDLRSALEKGYSMRQIETEPDLVALRATSGYRDLVRSAGAQPKR